MLLRRVTLVLFLLPFSKPVSDSSSLINDDEFQSRVLLLCPHDVRAHVGKVPFVLSREGQKVVRVQSLFQAFLHRQIIDHDAGTACFVDDAPAALVEQGAAMFDKQLHDADGVFARSNPDKSHASLRDELAQQFFMEGRKTPTGIRAGFADRSPASLVKLDHFVEGVNGFVQRACPLDVEIVPRFEAAFDFSSRRTFELSEDVGLVGFGVGEVETVGGFDAEVQIRLVLMERGEL